MASLLKNHHCRSIVLLLLSVLLCLTSAFQSPTSSIHLSSSFRQHASSQHSQHSQHVVVVVAKPIIVRTPFSSRTTTVSIQNQRKPDDSKETAAAGGGYNSKVEDGSPLGVAIVVLGGLLVNFGGEKFADVPVWVVLATASTAAGVARLIRYLQEKKQK